MCCRGKSRRKDWSKFLIMTKWKSVLISPETPLSEAIAKIDASGLQAALIVDENALLHGILTDGNIRRAILAGKNLQVPVSEVMNSKPTTVPVGTSNEEKLDLMRRLTIHHLPLVNDVGHVVGLSTLDDLIGATARPNWVVLMAGGLGQRLQPLTEDRPKPLLPVAGKPILEIIVEGFSAQGFKHIFLSINYKAEMIRDHFGDGSRWGVQIEYLHEKTRMGTAGALSLLPDRPTDPLLVMNGDLLIQTKFDNLLQFHQAHDAAATMAVREYELRVPYGVVRLDGARIQKIEEKPTQRFFINAGIYALSSAALDHLLPDEFCDMPTLFDRLISNSLTTSAYPLREYWLDIGRMEELERAQSEWPRYGNS